MTSAVVSLIFEPIILVLHIVVGLGFGLLVVAHLIQRRHVSANLAARLAKITGLTRPAGRLALTDALLTALTVAMLVSGFWDWFAGHPTRIRWHALTGVALAVVLAVHTIRRRSRLRRSMVR
jgi:dolichyl-phosphate-mannose--protein O-mannosyl transferase